MKINKEKLERLFNLTEMKAMVVQLLHSEINDANFNQEERLKKYIALLTFIEEMELYSDDIAS